MGCLSSVARSYAKVTFLSFKRGRYSNWLAFVIQESFLNNWNKNQTYVIIRLLLVSKTEINMQISF